MDDIILNNQIFVNKLCRIFNVRLNTAAFGSGHKNIIRFFFFKKFGYRRAVR